METTEKLTAKLENPPMSRKSSWTYPSLFRSSISCSICRSFPCCADSIVRLLRVCLVKQKIYPAETAKTTEQNLPGGFWQLGALKLKIITAADADIDGSPGAGNEQNGRTGFAEHAETRV